MPIIRINDIDGRVATITDTEDTESTLEDLAIDVTPTPARIVFGSTFASIKGCLPATSFVVSHAATGGTGSVKTVSVASFADLMNASMRTVVDLNARIAIIHTRIVRIVRIVSVSKVRANTRIVSTVPTRGLCVHEV